MTDEKSHSQSQRDIARKYESKVKDIECWIAGHQWQRYCQDRGYTAVDVFELVEHAAMFYDTLSHVETDLHCNEVDTFAFNASDISYELLGKLKKLKVSEIVGKHVKSTLDTSIREMVVDRKTYALLEISFLPIVQRVFHVMYPFLSTTISHWAEWMDAWMVVILSPGKKLKSIEEE